MRPLPTLTAVLTAAFVLTATFVLTAWWLSDLRTGRLPLDLALAALNALPLLLLRRKPLIVLACSGSRTRCG